MSFKDAVLTIFVAGFVLWSGYDRGGDIEGLFVIRTMECADAERVTSPEDSERALKPLPAAPGCDRIAARSRSTGV